MSQPQAKNGRNDRAETAAPGASEADRAFDSMSFEEAMEELEGIARDMRGEMSLEETLEKYARGKRLTALCDKKLREFEDRLEQLDRQYGAKDSDGKPDAAARPEYDDALYEDEPTDGAFRDERGYSDEDERRSPTPDALNRGGAYRRAAGLGRSSDLNRR